MTAKTPSSDDQGLLVLEAAIRALLNGPKDSVDSPAAAALAQISPQAGNLQEEAQGDPADGSLNILANSMELYDIIETLDEDLPAASKSLLVDGFLERLEELRAECPKEGAVFSGNKPRDVLLKELRLGYLLFCKLENLLPEHPTQQDHAKQMAKWLSDGARGEAPVTVWSISQGYDEPSLTSIFGSIEKLNGGGGAANGNTPQTKRSSSYALS